MPWPDLIEELCEFNSTTDKTIRISIPVPRGFTSNTFYLLKFISVFMLQTAPLAWISSEKADVNTRLFAGMYFTIMSSLLSFMLFRTVKNNIEEREFLKKLQALLEKPDLIKLIQTALEKNLTIDASQQYAPEILLTDAERAEAQKGLDFIRAWTEGSNQIMQILPNLFQELTGTQLIPQPMQNAIGRLLLQANVSPVKQVQDRIQMHEINPSFGKGGLYYLSVSTHSNNINLSELIKLAEQHRIKNLSLEQLILHKNTGYEEALQNLIDNPTPVVFEQFKKIFLNTIEKNLAHDQVQTATKLAAGAFGWELTYRVFLGTLGLAYNPNLLDMSLTKPALWLCTGIGAALALNISILTSQILFSQLDHGIDPKRYQILCAQLVFSVTLADGLWQPFADVSDFYLSILSNINPWLSTTAAPFVYFTAYLSLSFFFKEIHNWTNRIHTENNGQKKFVCDNQFVGILALAYWSFKVVLGLALAHIDVSEFTLSNIIIDALLAAICTGLLPALLIKGQNHYKMQQLRKDLDEKIVIRVNPFDIESAENNSASETLTPNNISIVATTESKRQINTLTARRTLSDNGITSPLLRSNHSDETANKNTQQSANNLLCHATTFGKTALGKVAELYDEMIQASSYLYP